MKYGAHYIKTKYNPLGLSKHSIDRQTVENIEDESTVLDIGCATGFLGEFLIKHKKCVVDGVDLGKDEAKIARQKLRKVFEGDIENDNLVKQIKEKYDVVNASALIEHLRDPWEALRTWKKFLKKDGHIIISTSNIAHFSTRAKLLRGKFEYQNYGILDNTHLRFFTTKTFPKLIKDCGYEVEYFGIDAEGGGYPRISILGSKFFPNFFAYQMIIKAKK